MERGSMLDMGGVFNWLICFLWDLKFKGKEEEDNRLSISGTLILNLLAYLPNTISLSFLSINIWSRYYFPSLNYSDSW